jgi:hypothetical protein
MGIAVEFLPVGDSDGDAIVVQYGDANGYKLHIVDGGYAQVGELKAMLVQCAWAVTRSKGTYLHAQ